MNKFCKSIKANNYTMQAIKAVEEAQKQQHRKMKFEDKVALAVYHAIQEIHTNSEDESRMKSEYMLFLNKVICNYDYLKPNIIESLDKKRQKGSNSYKEK